MRFTDVPGSRQGRLTRYCFIGYSHQPISWVGHRKSITDMTALEIVMTAMQAIFYASPLIIALTTFGLAWWRFKIFRVREPSITTDLRVSSRRCSPSYNALHAVAVLTNTSRVGVDVSGLEWSVFVLSPYTDEVVENKINEYAPYMMANESQIEFPWNVNYRISQEDPKIYLEPGESNTIGMSLAIPDWIESVDVLIELDSPPTRKDERLVWATRCPHDIPKERQNVNQA